MHEQRHSTWAMSKAGVLSPLPPLSHGAVQSFGFGVWPGPVFFRASRPDGIRQTAAAGEACALAVTLRGVRDGCATDAGTLARTQLVSRRHGWRRTGRRATGYLVDQLPDCGVAE
jgi:hypothetical protein